jgi:hypothetical protein
MIQRVDVVVERGNGIASSAGFEELIGRRHRLYDELSQLLLGQRNRFQLKVAPSEKKIRPVRWEEIHLSLVNVTLGQSLVADGHRNSYAAGKEVGSDDEHNFTNPYSP